MVMAKYIFEISRLRPSGFARNDREMTLEMTSPATKTAENVDECKLPPKSEQFCQRKLNR